MLRRLAAAGALAAATISVAGCGATDNRPCLRSHVETVTMPGYYQPVTVGTTTIMMYQSGYSYDDTVCDEYGPAPSTSS